MPTDPSSETLPADKVPLAAKISIGVAAMAGMFTGNLTKELLNPIYVVAFGLSPVVVGTAMMIFRLYDAFVDPVVGWLSDNTRTPMGRRRPYLLVGGILSALAMPLMWMVHREWTAEWQTGWLIGAGMILYTCASIHGVPYESFQLELTPDYKERTRVASFRMVISSLVGPVIGWSWYIVQLPMFNDPHTGKTDTLAGARGLAVIAGVLTLIVSVAPVVFARERFYATAQKQPKVSLRKSFVDTLGNRPFLILVGIALCAVTGTGLCAGLSFFTRLYYVCQGDQALAAKLTGVQATCWMPVSIAAVFLFQVISSRWSKTHALGAALGFCFCAVALRWWTYRPDMPWLCLSSSFLLAFGVTGFWQLLPSMNADVVDADEMATSTRREGAFAAIFSWFMKLSFTVGVGAPGMIAGWCGFVVGKTERAPGVLTALRLNEVLVPTTMLLGAMALLAIYPLSVRRMGEIRGALEARRGTL